MKSEHELSLSRNDIEIKRLQEEIKRLQVGQNMQLHIHGTSTRLCLYAECQCCNFNVLLYFSNSLGLRKSFCQTLHAPLRRLQPINTPQEEIEKLRKQVSGLEHQLQEKDLRLRDADAKLAAGEARTKILLAESQVGIVLVHLYIIEYWHTQLHASRSRELRVKTYPGKTSMIYLYV